MSICSSNAARLGIDQRLCRRVRSHTIGSICSNHASSLRRADGPSVACAPAAPFPFPPLRWSALCAPRCAVFSSVSFLATRPVGVCSRVPTARSVFPSVSCVAFRSVGLAPCCSRRSSAVLHCCVVLSASLRFDGFICVRPVYCPFFVRIPGHSTSGQSSSALPSVFLLLSGMIRRHMSAKSADLYCNTWGTYPSFHIHWPYFWSIA